MNAVYALYALLIIGLAYWVHHDDRFDFRGAGRLRRRAPGDADGGSGAEESDYDVARSARDEARALAKERRRLSRITVEPRADFVVALALGGIGALATGAVVGLLPPLGLEALAAGGAAPAAPPRSGPTDLSALRYGVEAPMGRLAQVVGAVCGAAIALRMLRLFMGLGGLLAVILFALVSVNFVIGRPALALFGQ